MMKAGNGSTLGSREGKSRLTTQDSGDNEKRTAPHYNNNNIMWPLQQNCHKFCLHDHQTIFKKSFVDIVKKKADNTKKLMEVNSKYSLFSQTNKEKQKITPRSTSSVPTVICLTAPLPR